MTTATTLSVPAQGGAPCEFPSGAPAKLGAEGISLSSLVHHRCAVNAAMPLELVQREFRQQKMEFMAVEKDNRVIGVCARGELGFIMSSRFGFALYSQQPIETVLVARPLIVAESTPIRTLLDQALVRTGDDFHEDVVLVGAKGELIGLIKVETLAQLQSRLVQEQLEELRRQREALRVQNLELFQASHAVRQSQGLYQSLFESHAMGIVLLDGKGVIHQHNRRLAELLNCGDESMAIASLSAWVVERERSAFFAVLEAHTRGAQAAGVHEFTLNVQEYGARLFRMSMGWIRETGQICACLEDVTEQRALERSALRQEKQSLLDTLVGGIAHELNNKLTPVQGFAELLQLEETGRTRGYVDCITKSVDEAARIIRQLLELSKPASNVSEVFDLRTVAEETMVMLKFQIREANCSVDLKLPATPVYVSADAAQMKQVALNLAINALHAVEHAPRRHVTLEVRQVLPKAELIVHDTGCGIPRENLGRIFDPFFTTKGPERGTGLGLSICYSLVRQHGGDIAVVSEVGAGARFAVTLPAQTATMPLLFLDRPPVSSADIQLRGSGKRVLVVEDELVLRRLMQEVLCTHFGCQVDLANNGLEALARIEGAEYALILSDIRMPEMDGTGLYLRLKESRPEMARRLVFVTGHPGDQHLRAEIERWNVPVLAKPFSLEKLSEVCRPFLEEAAEQVASA